jgi:hypothetical protein
MKEKGDENPKANIIFNYESLKEFPSQSETRE